MPPRIAIAPWAGPLQEPAGTGFLPQGEVRGVALVRIRHRVLPVAGSERVQRVAGELAVLGEGGDVVIHRPVHLVGVPLLQELLDDLDHLGDVITGPWVQVGALDSHEVGIRQEGIRVLLADLLWGQPLVVDRQLHLVPAGVGDLVRHVSDVGDVHDPSDVLALEPQAPADEVAQHERAHVADVDVAVDGRTARVHLHGPLIDGFDLLHLP